MDCFPGRECRKFFLLFWCFHDLKEQTLPKLQPTVFNLQGPSLKSPNSQFLLCRKINKTSLCSLFCLFSSSAWSRMHCLEEGCTRVVGDLGASGRLLGQWDVLGGWGCGWDCPLNQVLQHWSLLCQKGFVWKTMCFPWLLVAVGSHDRRRGNACDINNGTKSPRRHLEALQHNHRSTDWFGLEGKEHPAPSLCCEQGHFPQDQIFPSSLDLNTSRDKEPMLS